MSQKPIPAIKVRQLLLLSLSGNFNKNQSTKRLRIARSTATKYIKAFKRSELDLTDIEHIGRTKIAKLLFQSFGQAAQSDRKMRLLCRFASIHSRIEHDRLSILDAWREEVAMQQCGYKYSQFASLYASWRIEQRIGQRSRAKESALSVKPVDIPVLKKWRT